MVSDVARSVGLVTNSLTYYYRKKEDLAWRMPAALDGGDGPSADAAASSARWRCAMRAFIGRYLGLLAEIGEGRHAELIVFSDLLTLTPPQRGLMAPPTPRCFAACAGCSSTPTRRGSSAARATHAPTCCCPPCRGHAPGCCATSRKTMRVWPRGSPTSLLYGIAARARGSASMVAELHAARDSRTRTTTRTRAAYLRAATRLVNQHGYRGASVDRIAAVLQLTKGSFYHHHETKEELIAACFERTFAVMRAAQARRSPAPGSGLDRLATACRALLAFQMSPHGPLLRVTAWTGLPDPLRTRRGARWGDWASASPRW